MQVVSHSWVRVLTSCQCSGMTDQKSHENKLVLGMERELNQDQNTEMQKRYLLLENNLFKAVAEAESVLTQK